ncbi:hypothetical protein FACS189419_08760 [Planctomycetales bacterium]|nr:hypothetical protein FACS189419_08760 [Planctomycetales bacterium]
MIFVSIPVIIVFSLCYAAARHEDMRAIIKHAAHFGGWLTFSVLLIAVMLEILHRYLH